MARLKDEYFNTILPSLVKEFGYGNAFAAPRLSKIVLNMGVGKAILDSKILTAAAEELTLIAGQKAVITEAKKSIAGFKLVIILLVSRRL